jgi:hypothetical protein
VFVISVATIIFAFSRVGFARAKNPSPRLEHVAAYDERLSQVAITMPRAKTLRRPSKWSGIDLEELTFRRRSNWS